MERKFQEVGVAKKEDKEFQRAVQVAADGGTVSGREKHGSRAGEVSRVHSLACMQLRF